MIALPFGNLTGRALKGSIYRDFVPPEVEDSKALLEGYEKLSNMKKLSGKIDLKRMKPRDEAMYRRTEAYNPNQRQETEIVQKLLEEVEYAKFNT